MIVLSIKQLLVRLMIIAFALAAAVGMIVNHLWEDEWPAFVFLCAGLIMFLFPDEWRSYDGYRAWRTDQWRFQPEGWIRFCGAVTVIGASLTILTR